MNNENLKHIKKILINLYNDIINKKKKFKKNYFKNINYPDLMDRAFQEEENNFKLIFSDREYKLLKKIEKTLKKIKKDKFGNCEWCEKRINIERLKINPIAELCIECKRISEK
ncbi:RNA polymerase-binding protein DksA [Enterobacterales bacterium endosymbiont of Anomoneura mori]|uniref:TraR/DksA C4-type zinc finger protein n=1 Tax=Enterobacterales bacterium endosymbiont of Anomoneura mori TaxID=3132096 RepID=UPI00399C82F0